jgi:ferredoxin, 2Fe-2S
MNLPFSMVHWTQGAEHFSQEVDHGVNLMSAAQMAQVPGVIGECGGRLSCATCHVVVMDHWVGRVNAAVGPPCEVEEMMLDIVSAPRQTHSRLSCQLVSSPELDGLELLVPIA